MRLDHIAIAAETLDDGTAWAEARLGVPLLLGGDHARYGTHNRLLGLADGLYLEVIARNPDATVDGPRWFGLDQFAGPPRVANWICEADDFDTALVHGMEKVEMARGDLRWDMGVPPDGSLPLEGAFPTLLRWHTDTPPGQTLPKSGCSLLRLAVIHPQAILIEEEVGDRLQDPRVIFETGPQPGLSAQIETPSGIATL